MVYCSECSPEIDIFTSDQSFCLDQQKKLRNLTNIFKIHEELLFLEKYFICQSCGQSNLAKKFTILSKKKFPIKTTMLAKSYL